MESPHITRLGGCATDCPYFKASPKMRVARCQKYGNKELGWFAILEKIWLRADECKRDFPHGPDEQSEEA